MTREVRRKVQDNTASLEKRYAIPSHTWEVGQEVTFQDMVI